MTKFCKECGTSNEEDASFCDNCGAPMQRKTPAAEKSPSQSAPAISLPSLNRKTLLAILGVAVVTTAIGLGAWAWSAMKNNPPDTRQQLALAQQWIDANHARLLRNTCLTNFPYQHRTVTVYAWNRDTVAWMNELVAGDIYVSRGQDRFGNLIYEHGPAAQRYIKGSSLCLATGVRLEQTELLPLDTDPARAAAVRKTQEGKRLELMQIRYAWEGIPAFAQSPTFASEWPTGMRNTTTQITLYRGDEGWREATEADIARAAAEFESRTSGSPAPTAGSTFGLGDWLGQLFSFGGSSPERTAREFFEALSNGQVSQAIERIHPSQRSEATDAKLEMALEMQRGAQAQGNRSVNKIETILESEQGETALVTVKITHNNGRTSSERINLRQHHGKWYIYIK
ncbi:DUF4878 domain-containing protein [Tepidicella baoligensis]|uniref:DUF4878 domain-containing protein n=1 Tax=Tepidicella baoligensis TaxID=2707016 RepID=UPI0015DBC106|nr:DUF4878 domain-containing protein [Tepidicella baoligensis]